VQQAWFTLYSTRGAAVGTGDLGAEGLGLLFEQGGECAFGQSSGGGVGELLHGVEIGVESRAVVAEGASGDNFAPGSGEVVDFLEKFGGKRLTGHGESYLGVTVEAAE
jgi:hypothetical protein